MVHAHDTRAATSFTNALDQRSKNFIQRHTASGLMQTDTETGADPNYYFARIIPWQSSTLPFDTPAPGLLLTGYSLAFKNILPGNLMAHPADRLLARLSHDVARAWAMVA